MSKFPKSGTIRNRRTGEGKTGIVYSQYLNASGEKTTNPSLASYRVTVHDPSIMSITQVKFEARSLRLGGNHWCHGAINPSYIADQLTRASYIIKLEALNNRTGSSMQLGFASMINQGQKVLYIDLICVRVTDRVRAAAGLGSGSAGGLLMKQIIVFAQQPQFGFNKLKLSALPYVFGFYDKLGFRLDTPDTPKARKLTDNLRTFRFRSAEDFEMAHDIIHYLSLVKPPVTIGQPLTDEQKMDLESLINYYKTKLRYQGRGNLWGVVDRYYNEVLTNPERILTLDQDLEEIKQMGLAPEGIDNGIRMVYDVPPAQGGGAIRNRKTRRQQRRRNPKIRSRKQSRYTRRR